MGEGQFKQGIASARLAPDQYAKNFVDLHKPLRCHEALVEADRCYFCFDAPCQTACPAEIDIPLFIREISTSNPLGAAKTIFEQNIFGGMCARVCPVETLCEEVCVREEAEGRPVKIGQLQRFATDRAMAEQRQFFKRGAPTGKKVAIVGAGPAGIAAAHRLAMFGHDVEIFDAREKPGGLNEFGIASYKAVDDFAQQEIDYILSIGDIKIINGKALGRDFSLDDLSKSHDAVFLGVGLGGVNALRTENEDAVGIEDAVDFISELRQAEDLSKIAIGRDVVVIGGGMTAIDAAIQAKLLGAQNVTICYRRGAEQMGASPYEQELATSKGVNIHHWLAPEKILTKDGAVTGIELEYTSLESGKLKGTGHKTTLEADQIFKAIGQNFIPDDTAGIKLEAGRILVDEKFCTSNPNVFAGGDCVFGGDDLTVSAAANGRDAAENIHAILA